jgi:probable rRNA maturation factor
LGFPEAELSLLIVDDAAIAQLNQTYLSRTGPTNVIAFAMQEGEHRDVSPELLGDVVISIETAAAESGRAGISLQARFNQLLVHGILHLFGYDHENDPREAAKMDAKSDELLALIAAQSD